MVHLSYTLCPALLGRARVGPHRLRIGYPGTSVMMAQQPDACAHCLVLNDTPILHYLQDCQPQ